MLRLFFLPELRLHFAAFSNKKPALPAIIDLTIHDLIVIQLENNPRKLHTGWRGWVEFLLHLKLNDYKGL